MLELFYSIGRVTLYFYFLGTLFGMMFPPSKMKFVSTTEFLVNFWK